MKPESDKPVTYGHARALADIEDLRQRDLVFLLGLNIPNMIAPANDKNAIKDLATSALTRYLYEHPEAYFLPRFPHPTELLAYIHRHVDKTFGKYDLVRLLGRSYPQVTEWFAQFKTPYPTVYRWAYVVQQALKQGKNKAERKVILDKLMAFMEQEIEVRTRHGVEKRVAKNKL